MKNNKAAKEIAMQVNTELKQVYLKPGELCISNQGLRITTVLGSCVAVTMYHPSGVSAICHALQPTCPLIRICPAKCIETFKFADCVINEMVKQMHNHKIPINEIDTKLFGGSAMLNLNRSNSLKKSVGRMNIEASIEVLKIHKIKPKVIDVGGSSGRKIIFNTQNGEVLLKRVRSIRQNKF